MPTLKESFEHGEHNEKACELLKLNNFPDWAITTAFYASLHFVTSKIFPFEYAVNGSKITFIDISQWQGFKSHSSSKRHTLTTELVAKYCNKIASEYEWLLSASYNARYHSHSHLPQEVERAVYYMKEIKKYCDPGKKETRSIVNHK